MLSVLFALATGLVGWNTYSSWKAGPWELPTPAKSGGENLMENQAPPSIRPPVNTDVIVSKNLFDPERGAGATRDAEESSRAFQRVRGMILIGTVIIGDNRVAILQESTTSPGAGQRPSAQSAALMRLKVGDNVDGFRLTEIADKRVVFAKDASRVEVLLDYFRKVDAAQQPRPVVPGQVTAPPPQPAVPGQVTAPPPTGVPVPRVVPTLPRRGRFPAARSQP